MPPEPGTLHYRAAEATQELLRRGAAAGRAETSEARAIAVREAAEQATLVAKAWWTAAADCQRQYEAERRAEQGL